MSWVIQWDNGRRASGEFSQRFDTEESAVAAGTEWETESNLRDGIDPEVEVGYSFEVFEVYDEPIK